MEGAEDLDDATLKNICENLREDVRIALAICLPKLNMDENNLGNLSCCGVESAATEENAREFLSVVTLVRNS